MEVASSSRAKDEDDVSHWENGNVSAAKGNTGEAHERRRDEHGWYSWPCFHNYGSFTVPTLCTILFTLVVRFPVYSCFGLLFLTACSNCSLYMFSVRWACVLTAQYFLTMLQNKYMAPWMQTSFKVDKRWLSPTIHILEYRSSAHCTTVMRLG